MHYTWILKLALKLSLGDRFIHRNNEIHSSENSSQHVIVQRVKEGLGRVQRLYKRNNTYPREKAVDFFALSIGISVRTIDLHFGS